MIATASMLAPILVLLATIDLSVDTHRPLAALADELQKRYPIVITYEEGAWAGADVDKITPGSVTIPVPRKAAVTFHYVEKDGAGYDELLSALVTQYHDAGAPGEFRVEGHGSIYHLIPSGQAMPLLSTPVTLADKERTINDTLDEVVAQLNAPSPRVGWGYVPLNLFVQTRVRIAADKMPAREVFRRVVEEVARQRGFAVTWRLNYDPLTERSVLSFLVVPK